MNITIRCDGGQDLGLGHIVRCLALADELADAHGCNISFAMLREPGGIEMVSARYPVIRATRTSNFAYGQWLRLCCEQTESNLVVLDTRDALPPAELHKLKHSNIRIATIDDPEAKRLEADLAFYPPVPQLDQVSWERFDGALHAGPDYVLLRRQFAEHYPAMEHALPRVMVSMGGADPFGLTIKGLQALQGLETEIEAVIVIGAVYPDHSELEALLPNLNYSYELHQDVGDMAPLMASCDAALAVFGMTGYELTAMGVPAVYLGLTQDHLDSAQYLEDSGVASVLGIHGEVPQAAITKAMEAMLSSPQKLSEQSAHAKSLIDGQGVQRIARIMVEDASQLTGSKLGE